ncbi:hypothetical protein GCM10011529_10590 [Polymorphobacter glacialis]|uniref:Uncharacterized protein n=1 Tax=Sandarakinorhabdus glacialis TaxID=1614636 RepID=A0A916ZNE3_9SPHN|nr:hypothetical protein GCM10011529_10590 [Polymorphobacter glacialis]
MGAGGGEDLGEAPAEAGGGAGDKGDLAGKVGAEIGEGVGHGVTLALKGRGWLLVHLGVGLVLGGRHPHPGRQEASLASPL